MGTTRDGPRSRRSRRIEGGPVARRRPTQAVEGAEAETPTRGRAPAQQRVEITRLLHRAVRRDPRAADELFAAIYDDLRALARMQMSGRYHGTTLQPTALVHDSYLKLLGRQSDFENRSHFLAYVARMMRNMLASRARTRLRARAKTPDYRTHLESVMAAYDQRSDDVLDLHGALKRFRRRDRRAADVMEMYYFAGAPEPAIAEAMGMTERTVRRDLVHAKAWLAAELDR